MSRVVAVNGSPHTDKGVTSLLLTSFLKGMESAGAECQTFYASRLRLRPCDCCEMRCWFVHPGMCYHHDDMDDVYPQLREADIVIIATPVYVPLPSALQDVLNRLCPLMDPTVEIVDGRTRARLRTGVAIKKFVALSTGGWWEKENSDTVVRIVRELAENAGVEFSGAVVRPHADLMESGDGVTPAGKAVLEAAEVAGRQLVCDGRMDPAILDAVSLPLISCAAHVRLFNRSAQSSM